MPTPVWILGPIQTYVSEKEYGKGGLISESFSVAKQMCQYLEHYPPKEKMLRIVIWHIFWRWRKSEIISEIKLPLLQNNRFI